MADNAEYDLQRLTDVSGGSVTDVDWARLPGALLSVRKYTDNTAVYVSGSTATSYHYRVRAVIDGNNGEWSNVMSVPIPATSTLPASPTLTVSSTSLNSITVSWDAVDTATSYELRFKREDGDYSTPRRVGRPYRHTGLTSQTKYTYEVRSKNVNGYSEWSDAASGETAGPTGSGGGSLSSPSNLRVASATDKSKDAGERIRLKVTWSAVSGATGYDLVVWDSTTEPPAWKSVTLDSEEPKKRAFTFPGTIESTAGDVTLAADKDYYFAVRAQKDEDNSMDMSDWSTPVQGKAKALAPDEPLDLKAFVTGSSSIWLSWDEPESASGTKGATSYTLRYRSAAGSGNITVNGTTYAHTGLRHNTDYYYRVRANNSGGSSSWEPDQSSQPTEVNAKTAPQGLEMPTGLGAADASDVTDSTIDASKIKVSWGAVTGAAMYEVQKWEGSTWVSARVHRQDILYRPQE